MISVGRLLPAARFLFARHQSLSALSPHHHLTSRSTNPFLVEVRTFSTTKFDMEKLKVAVIGQSQFAAEVYKKVNLLTFHDLPVSSFPIYRLTPFGKF